MSNNQLNQKQFKCFDCKNEVKLQRKDDDSGWLRFNLDNTPHNCQKKKFFSSKQSQNDTEVKDLLRQVLLKLNSIEAQIAAK